jgi:hypothetical protein
MTQRREQLELVGDSMAPGLELALGRHNYVRMHASMVTAIVYLFIRDLAPSE